MRSYQQLLSKICGALENNVFCLWAMDNKYIQPMAHVILDSLLDCLKSKKKILHDSEITTINLADSFYVKEGSVFKGTVVLKSQDSYRFDITITFLDSSHTFESKLMMQIPESSEENLKKIIEPKKDEHKERLHNFYTKLGFYPFYNSIERQWVFSGTRDGLERLVTHLKNMALHSKHEQSEPNFEYYVVNYTSLSDPHTFTFNEGNSEVFIKYLRLTTAKDTATAFISHNTFHLTSDTFFNLGDYLLSLLRTWQINDPFVVTEFIEHTRHSLQFSILPNKEMIFQLIERMGYPS